MKTLLTIKGTHCQACKTLIENFTKDIPGVISCTVDYQTGKTEVEHDASLQLEKLKNEIQNLGSYGVEEI